MSRFTRGGGKGGGRFGGKSKGPRGDGRSFQRDDRRPPRDRNERRGAPERGRRGERPARDEAPRFERRDAPGRRPAPRFERGEAPARREAPGFERREAPGRREAPRSSRGDAPARRDAAGSKFVTADGHDGPRSYGDERFVYGVNPVLELLRARPGQVDRISMQQQGLKESVAGEIFSRAREHGIRVDTLERDRLDAMAPRAAHQGVVAEVRQFDYATLEDILEAPKQHGRPGLVIVLDGIQDPMNLGAIIRSAHAFGADGVVIAKDRAAAVTGVVAKASAGATAHTKIARVTNLARALETLKEAGYWSVAAEPTGEKTLWDAGLDGPLAVVVGAEGAGVRKGMLEHCDFLVRIPMVGQVASLNASVSAAVLLAEVARRRAVKA